MQGMNHDKAGMFLLFLIVASQINVQAQNTSVPRDTSYTVRSTLEKVRKYNKNVTAVYPHPSDRITVEKEIVYRSLGDRRLTANLFYPKKKSKKMPALLIIHGGGWRAGDKSLMTPMAERIADAGYFVMAAEYRLSLEATYPAAVADLYDALQWMCDNAVKYSIDVNRFVVMGCSAGGQLAALIGTTYNNPVLFNPAVERKTPGHVCAIVDVDGVLAFKHPDSQEGTVASQWLGGTFEEKPETWNEASALYHVDQYTPPTLFLASMYPRFLAGRQDYISKLQPFGTKSETRFLENAPHSFWLLNPWFEPTVGYVLKFLEEAR